MKRFALVLCLAFAAPILAAPPIAEPPMTEEQLSAAGLSQPGPVVYGAAPVVVPPALDDSTTFLKLIFTSVKSGNWWAAASAFLVLVVSLLRTYGKKLHELLPDNLLWDKPFWFIFDTKPGGWLLNIATAVAGGTGTALMAGEPVTWALVKPILTVAVTGAALWEMGKDFVEWFKSKRAAPETASSAAPTAPGAP